MLQLLPKIPYSQPKAFCRTLVYTWASELLMTDTRESVVISGLVTKNSPQAELEQVRETHVNKRSRSSPTVAYPRPDATKPADQNRMFSAKIPLASNTKKSFHGTALAPKHPATNGTVANDCIKLLSQSFVSKGQYALAVSFHYRYPKLAGTDDEESSHTVGFLFSQGGFGKRSSGMRFFDPNNGSWRFTKKEAGFDFFRNDWLPNYLANSMKGDPGTSGKGPREMQFFRVVGFSPN